MARHNRRRVEGAPADQPEGLGDSGGLSGAAGERREGWRGEDYVVRSISGAAASKPYRCPGCDQEILVRQPHVVTWPAHDAAAADRRHWHTACWSARERREPGIQRSRSAPRY